MKTLEKKVYSFEELKEKLIPVFKQYQLPKASVFGSYARGKAKPASDVDLLLLFDETFNLEKYLNFENAIKRSLNKKVEIVEYDGLIDLIRDEVMKEAIEIYCHT